MLENLVSLWTVHWQLIVGAVFMICVLFFPAGIWGTILKRINHDDFDNRHLIKGHPAHHRRGKKFGKFVALNNISANSRGRDHVDHRAERRGQKHLFQPAVRRVPAVQRQGRIRRPRCHQCPQHEFAHMGIAKSFQITNVFPLLTTRENVRVGLQAWCRAMTSGVRERNFRGLWRRRMRCSRWSDCGNAASGSQKTLAHGEQRALEIGMALAANPRLLLLDEPTAGMSPEETRVMMDLIVKLVQERTVILVEHKMKLVMGISDRVLVLHHGELLAQGTPTEVRQNDQVKRVYLGQREH
jgi:branched-chain amino acid transport system ATP-binding protein